eukprot:scaffold27579_cov36-Prasinocladus_malaysianus.AAC.1
MEVLLPASFTSLARNELHAAERSRQSEKYLANRFQKFISIGMILVYKKLPGEICGTQAHRRHAQAMLMSCNYSTSKQHTHA